MNITHLQHALPSAQLSEIDNGSRAGSLDDVLKDALVRANGAANADKSAITTSFESPLALSDPGRLVELQTRLSDYNIYVSLTSTLARKAVSTVETLVKAQ
ncbi:hypothetical protein WJ60_06400 [Burkholderia ubonensis]|uniref:type III secretion system inner rod subunit SctI n=1 Tax=Burkholderia ubonensis TaxID=101571 RepID=UPI00075AE181|nr:type III secretion system inner rod subunit SctI [Burkholderia ubonensis]KVM73948.1 hypothetical protein WJ60_06400 [Burkholderia ubonensis]